MGETIPLIPKSERERSRLIREARAIYDSIFPPEMVIPPVESRGNGTQASHAVSGDDTYRGGKGLSS